MADEKLGVEAVKEAVSVAVSFALQAAKTIKGKFRLIDAFAFIDEFKGLAEVIGNIKTVGAELKDMDVDERQEVIDHIKAEFSIPDDQVEGFVEYALQWANSTLTLFEKAKALKKKK